MADQEEVTPTKLLIQAIARATWPDKKSYELVRHMLVTLDNDLEEGNYEPSSVMDDDMENLNEYLNPENTRDEPSEADADDDEEDENALRDLDEDE